MKHNIHHQFRNSNKLVCVSQVYIDLVIFNHFVCHQIVSGVVISTTRSGSPFWSLCVPSGSKWCGYFNHKAWLTILASFCAISL